MEIEPLKDVLAKHLERTGKSEREVARDLGVSASTIGNWLKGMVPKNQSRLMQIIQYCTDGKVRPVDPPPPNQRDEKVFIESLPPELREYVEGRVSFGTYTVAADYLSTRLCVEIKQVLSENFITSEREIERGLFQLATIKQLYAMRGSADVEFWLLIIGRIRTLGKLQPLSTIHGIQIREAPDIEGAAAMIADFEFGPLP